ncbi:hypothetical protein [Allorhodopirellula heiligendammensis]|uniref:Uncharacterized protein n=1 Tax=Allorhodopirellula heiligendammensis TaxID=2714739 RepID=A0A5C6B4B9_9BACT|nr:hypothetical protein [Allorhodopirellula heiligendammensis]TWU05334.1 hypothetical protein Poly21_57610 [Allorhodopirellula heiligendammensis]
MILDPTEEIKSIRHRLGAEMDFDLDRIIADVQQRQKDSGRIYTRLPKREPRGTIRCNGAAESSELAVEDLSPPPADR